MNKTNKRKLQYLIVSIILIALVICLGIYFVKKFSNNRVIQELTYSYWDSVNESDNTYYLNQLIRDNNGEYHFFYRYGIDDSGEKILNNSEISKFSDIIRSNNIDKWDGYNSQDKEYPNNGFILHVEYTDGKK